VLVGERVGQRVDLADRLLAAQQPAVHPAGRRLALLDGEPVRGVGRVDVHALRPADPRVEPLGIEEQLPGAAEVERHVARAGTDQRGPGRTHDAVVGLVHAKGDLPADVLLAVLRSPAVNQAAERGEIATGGGRDDPVVQRHQIGRFGPAAGIARTADPVGADVRPALQVVDHPHAVPDSVLGDVRSQQGAPQADHRVLGRTQQPHAGMRRRHVRGVLELAVLSVRVDDLVTLSLADRVVADRGHGVLGQQDGSPLVLAGRLDVGAVTARDEHGRPGRRRLRQVQVGRDVEPWPAFQQDLFHAVALPFQAADDPSVQRRPFRQAADLAQEERAPVRLPGAAGGLALDRLLERFAAAIHLPVEFLFEPQLQLLAGSDAVRGRRENRQVLGGASGRGDEEQEREDRGDGLHDEKLLRGFPVSCGESFQRAADRGLASWKLTPLVSRTVLTSWPGSSWRWCQSCLDPLLLCKARKAIQRGERGEAWIIYPETRRS